MFTGSHRRVVVQLKGHRKNRLRIALLAATAGIAIASGGHVQASPSGCTPSNTLNVFPPGLNPWGLTIQQAVNQVQASPSLLCVHVNTGTYSEIVTIQPAFPPQAHGLYVFGDGMAATIIQGSINILNMQSVEVSDLAIVNSPGNGIWVKNGGPFNDLVRVKVTESQVHGISVDDTSYLTLEDVVSNRNGQSFNQATHANGGAGVWLLRAAQINIVGGEFKENNNQGIAIDSSQHIVVDGVVAQANLDTGVGMSNLSSRCLNADASQIQCLAAGNTTDVLIQNSWLDDNQSAGIGSDGAQRVTIRDNLSISRNGAGNVFAGRIGIFMTHTDDFLIENNAIGNNGVNACVGVGVYWCSNGQILGTNVIDNGHNYRCLEFGNDGVVFDPSLGCQQAHQDPCIPGAILECGGGVPLRFDIPSQNCENCQACLNNLSKPQASQLPPKLVTSPPGACLPNPNAMRWLECQ